MKSTIIALTILTTFQLGYAQERLSRDEALKYAAIAGANTKQLEGTPLTGKVDLKQPVAVRDGEFGGMLLPDTKLTVDTLAKADETVAPVGQLWLLRLAPMSEGAAISKDKLRLATIQHEGETYTVPQCALGVRRTSSGGLELLIFGKDKEPLIKAALKPIDAKQDAPLDFEADRQSDCAEITLKILGKYQAKFKVTEMEL